MYLNYCHTTSLIKNISGGEIGNISGNYVSNDSNFSANIKSCAAITGNTKNEHCFKDVFQDCVNNFHEDSISEIRSKELKCDNAQNFIRYESSCEQQIECQKSSRLLLDEDINRGSNVNSYQVNNYESMLNFPYLFYVLDIIFKNFYFIKH